MGTSPTCAYGPSVSSDLHLALDASRRSPSLCGLLRTACGQAVDSPYRDEMTDATPVDFMAPLRGIPEVAKVTFTPGQSPDVRLTVVPAAGGEMALEGDDPEELVAEALRRLRRK